MYYYYYYTLSHYIHPAAAATGSNSGLFFDGAVYHFSHLCVVNGPEEKKEQIWTSVNR